MTSKLRVLPWVVLLLPLDFIVAIALLVTEIFVVGFPPQMRRGKPKRPSSSPVGRSLNRSLGWSGVGQTNDSSLHLPQATIVIVNWDGKHLLAECLPSVIEAVNYAGGKHEILVVDNGSTDGSIQFVKEQFPVVRVLSLSRNYGFGGGNNRAVQAVQTNIVLFLNNDMVVDRAFLQPLLRSFEDESVFAVSSQIVFADPARRREETGKTHGRFEKGFFDLRHDDIQRDDERRESIPIFWAGGGSCAVDRKKFLAIGGFDSLYAPFYVEDTDISYQAWKRGWKCLLAPASRVTHKHRGTSKARFGDWFIDNTTRRNTYLFIWKNVTDKSMVFEHLLNLPRAHSRAMIQNGPRFEIQAFVRAFLRLPAALIKRISNSRHYVISDKDVPAQT